MINEAQTQRLRKRLTTIGNCVESEGEKRKRRGGAVKCCIMPNVAIVWPEGRQAGCMPHYTTGQAYLPQVVAPTRDSRKA